jgi:hypothetical protein
VLLDAEVFTPGFANPFFVNILDLMGFRLRTKTKTKIPFFVGTSFIFTVDLSSLFCYPRCIINDLRLVTEAEEKQRIARTVGLGENARQL